MKYFLLSIYVLTIILGSSFFIFSPAPAYADLQSDISTQSSGFAGKQGANLGKARDPREIAADIIKVFLGILGMVALSFTVYAGYLIMTAGGNEEQVTKGKKTLSGGVIGLLIILSSYSITLFIANRFATGDAGRQGTYVEIEKRFDKAKVQDPLYN